MAKIQWAKHKYISSIKNKIVVIVLNVWWVEVRFHYFDVITKLIYLSKVLLQMGLKLLDLGDHINFACEGGL